MRPEGGRVAKLKITRAQLAAMSAEDLLELERVESQHEANPLLSYVPHERQLLVHGSPKRLRCAFGGNQSGKTTVGLVDDLIQCIDRSVVPDHLRSYKRFDPPFHCRVVIPDLGNSLEGVSLAKLREWCPPDQLIGGSFQSAWSKPLRVLSFKNGSWLQFMSNDQEIEKFGGASLDRVHYDEEPRRDIHVESLFRVAARRGDLLLTMTPLLGMSWVFEEIYEPWEKARSEDRELEDIECVLMDIDDNPHMDEAGKRWALAGVSSEEERQARKSGRFVSFGGLIYPEFDRDVHVVPQGPPPPDAIVYVGIDPGIRHMAAVVWCYVSPDDDLVVFEQLALKGSNAGELAAAIHGVNAGLSIQPRAYVIDPSAKNRSLETGRALQDVFAQLGIPTMAGQNAHTAGFSVVKQRLSARKLHIGANCGELIDEFRKYRWKTPRRSSRDQADPPEQPVKVDDHLLDALRYVCMARPLKTERPDEGAPLNRLQRAIDRDIARLDRPKHQFGAIYS